LYVGVPPFVPDALSVISWFDAWQTGALLIESETEGVTLVTIEKFRSFVCPVVPLEEQVYDARTIFEPAEFHDNVIEL
jgi:hypothetical protein